MSIQALPEMPKLIPSADEVLQMLAKEGAFRHGHFVSPQGEHSEHYFQMPLALRHSQVARELGVALSRVLRGVQDVRVALPRVTLISPGPGGIPLAFNAQVALSAELIYWGELEGGQRRFRQYVEFTKGQKCVVIDDIVRSGSALQEITKLVHDADGEIIAYATVVRFTSAPSEIDGVPILALAEFATPHYNAANWPPDKTDLPVEQVRF